ncbi:hypothetical protein [Heyndrickxia acidiproducens]|jgi:hypothetical protein|uniref:hypothetical protein n=1 Tax=Heyndrickxia acidiproducens TaxID=1121084 RepID=UPI0003818D8A|nr:hypothetical protein [Heyndrickxia acidiproducens]
MDNGFGIFFKAVRGIARIFFPAYKADISRQIDGPVVYISHHRNLFGPFITLLWYPRTVRTWILHVFLDRKACYQQYAGYTFTKRFGLHPAIAKPAAFLLSFGISRLLQSGKSIPVYRGSKKILRTFQMSVEALQKGESVAIFPDIDYTDSSASVKGMYNGFLYLEKYYYKKTGRHVRFVPLYASKRKRLLVADAPICFRDGENFRTEKEVVYEKLHTALNTLAEQSGEMEESMC